MTKMLATLLYYLKEIDMNNVKKDAIEDAVKKIKQTTSEAGIEVDLQKEEEDKKSCEFMNPAGECGPYKNT